MKIMPDGRLVCKIHPPPFPPESVEAYFRFLDEWDFVGVKSLVLYPYAKAEDVLDFAGCWWRKRKVPRNRCRALVRAGHWDPPTQKGDTPWWNGR